MISHSRRVPAAALFIVVCAAAPATAWARDGGMRVAAAKAEQRAREHIRKGAEAFRDGWYQSGDLGFLLDGELFVDLGGRQAGGTHGLRRRAGVVTG